MDLKYITQLDEQEMIELINFCIRENNKKQELDEIEIDSVVVLKDRKDLDGNKYIRIYSAANEGVLQLHWYKLTDYSMQTDDLCLKQTDLSEYYKVFLANKFGESYLSDLYNFRVTAAFHEILNINEQVQKFGSRN